MQTPIRYYITCDEDRPVVRTIPVPVRKNQPTAEQKVATATSAPVIPNGAHDTMRPRVRKLALAKARQLRVRADRS